MRLRCRGMFGRLLLAGVLLAGGPLAASNPAFAENSAGTPLDHTNWESDSSHFKLLEFFTMDAPSVPVSLTFADDDLGWNEDYSVSGNRVTISPFDFDKDNKTENTDSFTGSFTATALTGTHVWTDEDGAHTQTCTYRRANF